MYICRSDGKKWRRWSWGVQKDFQSPGLSLINNLITRKRRKEIFPCQRFSFERRSWTPQTWQQAWEREGWPMESSKRFLPSEVSIVLNQDAFVSDLFWRVRLPVRPRVLQPRQLKRPRCSGLRPERARQSYQFCQTVCCWRFANVNAQEKCVIEHWAWPHGINHQSVLLCLHSFKKCNVIVLIAINWLHSHWLVQG